MPALGFNAGMIRTLVSMATNSDLRVIMGEILLTLFTPTFLIGSSSLLQVTITTIIFWTSSNYTPCKTKF